MIISILLNLLLNNDPVTLNNSIKEMEQNIIEYVHQQEIDNIAIYNLFTEDDKKTEFGSYISEELSYSLSNNEELNIGVIDPEFVEKVLNSNGYSEDFRYKTNECSSLSNSIGTDAIIFGVVKNKLNSIELKVNIFSQKKGRIDKTFYTKIPLNKEIKQLIQEAEEQDKLKLKKEQQELMFLNLSWSDPSLKYNNEQVYKKRPIRYMFKIEEDQTFFDLDINILGNGFIRYRIKKGGNSLYESWEPFATGSYEYNEVFDKGIYELYIDHRGIGGSLFTNKNDPKPVEYVSYCMRSNVPIFKENL